jgi:AcrR family transcriptional regulator
MSNVVSRTRKHCPQTTPSREDGVETRNRLIAAAGPIFGRDGFNAAGLREICQHAEASLGAIRYYFGNKQTLYRETLIAAYSDVVTTTSLNTTSLQDWLQHFIETLVRRREKYPYLPAMIARELAHPTAVFEELMRDYFKPLQQQLAHILREETKDTDRKQMANSLAIRAILICTQTEYFRPVLQHFGEKAPQTKDETQALAAEIYRSITLGFL